MRIPEKGLDRDALFERMEAYRADDLKWRTGRTFGYIYDPGRAAEEVGKAAYAMFLSENGLDPTVFPSLLRLETELIGMAVSHLHGPEGATGNFTSGGTESIILAVKAAREHARATRPEIATPELLIPTTGHAAFHKAAEYLGLKIVSVAVDPETYKANPVAMRAAITENTVLLVASAPSYAHGVIDPIEELGAIALEAGVLFHVDACVGGFLLPYFERLGEPVPAFDFAVPGVTSMSMDFHKYAFAPKGASCVLYRDRALRRRQIFACSHWTGYTVVNAAVQSSKTGGPLAAAWAVLNFLGDEGYLELARRTLEGTKQLIEGIDAIDGLEVMGRPEFCMVAATSDQVSVFHVCDEMKERGWYVQAQLAYACSKENIHFSLNPGNATQVGPLLEDLAASVEASRELESGKLGDTVKGIFASMGDAPITDEMFTNLLKMAGVEGARLPDRMAEINEILNALPRDVCQQLIIAFIGDLFMPPKG